MPHILYMNTKFNLINISILLCFVNAYLTSANLSDDELEFSCRPVSSMKLEDELAVPKIISKQFELKRLVLLIRHGDRGPLLPTRNLDHLDCDPHEFGVLNNTVNIELLDEYMSAVNNGKLRNISVPTDSHCYPNKLTKIGILQELTVGSQLGMLYRTMAGLKLYSSQDSIEAYCTPSLRTYESANAFLYGFLGPKMENDFNTFPKVKTAGYDFCLNSKYCDLNYTKISKNTTNTDQYNITTIAQAINYMQYFAPFVAPNQTETKRFKTPTDIADAILTYYCHNSSIPCIEKNSAELCADPDKSVKFMEFVLELLNEMYGWQSTSNDNLKLMYGFIDNILSITATTNSTNEKFVLFSAHDDTILAFLSAIRVSDVSYPSFASRVVIENYVSTDGETEQSYIRVVYNGKDVTRFTEFCLTNETNCLSHETGLKLINVNMFKEFIIGKFDSLYETNA